MAERYAEKKKRRLKNRSGMILILALLIMALMSLVGSFALTTSRVDLQVTYNTRMSRQSFYFADGGVEMSPKIVRAIIQEDQLPSYSELSFGPNLMNEVLGLTSTSDSVYDTVTDVSLTRGTNTAKVDVKRTATSQMAGGGAEFGAGSEGVGTGAVGGVLVFYTFDALGQAPNSTESHIDAYYRYVLGVAGGK